jgi:prepilin-type N-terminal cleavage/methylation domain-containing protein
MRLARARGERGFTLIEVVVALGITGMILSAAGAGIFQVITINARSTSHMTAVKEVENAVHWLSLDGEMAQFSENATATSERRLSDGLVLAWTNAFDGMSGSVTYRQDGDRLVRDYTPNGGATLSTVIAEHVDFDVAQSSWSYSGGYDPVLRFKVTAYVGGMRPSRETRSFEVIPRSSPG